MIFETFYFKNIKNTALLVLFIIVIFSTLILVPLLSITSIKYALFLYMILFIWVSLFLLSYLKIHIYVVLLIIYFLGGTGFHLGSIIQNNVFLIQYPFPLGLFLLVINLYLLTKKKVSLYISNKVFFVFIIFLVWSDITLIYSQNTEYGLYKLLHLIFDFSLAYTSFLVIKNYKNILFYLYIYIETFLILFYLAAILDFLVSPKDLSILGFDKNTFSREVLFLTLILNRTPYYLMSGITLFIAGSRLSFITYLIVLAVLLLKFKKKCLKYYFIILLFIIVGYFVSQNISLPNSARYILLLLNILKDPSIVVEALNKPEVLKSVGLFHRFFYFLNFEIPLDSAKILFGFGLGSFNIYWFQITQIFEKRIYPHSLPIEIFIETGLLGLAIFTLFLIMLFKYTQNRLLFFSMLIIFTFTATLEHFKLFLLVIIFLLIPWVKNSSNYCKITSLKT